MIVIVFHLEGNVCIYRPHNSILEITLLMSLSQELTINEHHRLHLIHFRQCILHI